MKKKLLPIMLAIFLVPCMFFMTACKEEPPVTKASSLNIASQAHTTELSSTLSSSRGAQGTSGKFVDYDFDNLSNDLKYDMAIMYVNSITTISQFYEGFMTSVNTIETTMESLGQDSFNIGGMSKEGNVYTFINNYPAAYDGHTTITVNSSSFKVEEYDGTTKETAYVEESTVISFNKNKTSFKIEEKDFEQDGTLSDHEFFEITVFADSAAIQVWDMEDSKLMQIKYTFTTNASVTTITSFNFACSDNATTQPSSIYNKSALPTNFATANGSISWVLGA